MQTVLDVKNLCKTYVVNKLQNNVLRNVELQIKEGELVAVMGPSGSGKSTLLYCVSGMDQMTSGSIQFYDYQIETMKQEELSRLRLTKMGFIFQQMYMLKNLSIYDNIILTAYENPENRNKDKKEINEYAKELMRKTGIIDVAENDITEVSGGQLQRACICRSLMNRPKILFADEPTGALNQQASAGVMDEILRFNQEGTTVMLVTHDVRVAAKADRILYIVDGNIKGEFALGKYLNQSERKDRERRVSTWLNDMGW